MGRNSRAAWIPAGAHEDRYSRDTTLLTIRISPRLFIIRFVEQLLVTLIILASSEQMRQLSAQDFFEGLAPNKLGKMERGGETGIWSQ
jgi:hypothetical protein